MARKHKSRPIERQSQKRLTASCRPSVPKANAPLCLAECGRRIYRTSYTGICYTCRSQGRKKGATGLGVLQEPDWLKERIELYAARAEQELPLFEGRRQE